MKSQQCAFLQTKKYFLVRWLSRSPIDTCSSYLRCVTRRVQSLMMKSMNTMSMQRLALMMKAAMKSPFVDRKGFSVELQLLAQMAQMMGSREVAARTQTATSKMLQEGVGGMTVRMAQMKLMQVATMRVEEPIFWPRTWSPEVDSLQRNSTSPRKERKKMGMQSWMMVPSDAFSMGMRMMALQQESSRERSSAPSSCAPSSSSGWPFQANLLQLKMCFLQKRRFLMRSQVLLASMWCCFSRVQWISMSFSMSLQQPNSVEWARRGKEILTLRKKGLFLLLSNSFARIPKVSCFPSFSCMQRSSTAVRSCPFPTLLTHSSWDTCSAGRGLGISMFMQLKRSTSWTSLGMETLMELRVVTRSRSFCSSGKKRMSERSPNLNSRVTMKLLQIRPVPPNWCSLNAQRMVRSLSDTLVLRSSPILSTKSFWKVTFSFSFSSSATTSAKALARVRSFWSLRAQVPRWKEMFMVATKRQERFWMSISVMLRKWQRTQAGMKAVTFSPSFSTTSEFQQKRSAQSSFSPTSSKLGLMMYSLKLANFQLRSRSLSYCLRSFQSTFSD